MNLVRLPTTASFRRNSVQIKTVFNTAVQHLKKSAVPDPELEAALLLSHVLQLERTAILLSGEKTMNDIQLAAFEKLLDRRLQREPLAYITGEKEFWSCSFKVSKDVLVPRPETEFLLEKVLNIVKTRLNDTGEGCRALDLGTGSGIIAIIMALELPAAEITAVDYSLRALEIARFNSRNHMVADRVHFVNSDWFSGIKSEDLFDVVISNPPYIAKEILAKPNETRTGMLQPEVGFFEPRLALNGGNRGTEEIIRIAAELENFLKPGGWFFMEIGADQKKDIIDIFQKKSVYDTVTIFNDYAGLPRVLQVRKKIGSN